MDVEESALIQLMIALENEEGMFRERSEIGGRREGRREVAEILECHLEKEDIGTSIPEDEIAGEGWR